MFNDNKELFYVTFEVNREHARWRACDYFKKSMHPEFASKDWWRQKYDCARAYRLPSLDKYAKKGVAPVSELLKAGITFHCSMCGKHTFNYEDFEDGKCFVFEGEGNATPYADGFILCYECYKKYVK